MGSSRWALIRPQQDRAREYEVLHCIGNRLDNAAAVGRNSCLKYGKSGDSVQLIQDRRGNGGGFLLLSGGEVILNRESERAGYGVRSQDLPWRLRPCTGIMNEVREYVNRQTTSLAVALDGGVLK